MKKSFIVSLIITISLLSLTSCSADDDFQPNTYEKESIETSQNASRIIETSQNASRIKAKTRAAMSASTGWQTIEYSGSPNLQTFNNQKVLLSGTAVNGVTGYYICQVVKVSCTVNVQDPDEEMIRGVSNESRCGFVPGTASTSSPIRGTQAIVNPSNPSQYTITSVCYKIITNMGGIAYPSNYWVPCNPNDVTLFYQYRSF